MNQSDNDRDGRNPVARGYLVADRVFAIAMQMAIPPAVGWWVDGKLNTSPWLLAAGGVLGFVSSMYLLLKLANESNDDKDGK